MKKHLFIFLFCAFLLLCLAVSAFAADKVVFVANGGTGDGASASAPTGKLADAYAALGDEGGTLVLMNKYSLSARIDLPKHSGKITWTSVYNNIDYRESGAMLYWAGSYRIGFGGPTKIDNFVFTDASDAGGVLAANFHDLTIGEDVQTLNTSGATESKILVLGGPNIDTSVAALASGESSTLTLKSGSYASVIAFSRAVAKSHEGTVTVNLGGNASAKNCCLGADGNNAKGGSAVLNLSDSAHIDSLNLSNSPAAAMNGTVTVNITDTASIDTLTNTASALYYEATASLPSTFADHFDTATQIEIPAGKVVFVSMGASGTGESAGSPVGTLAAAYAVLGDEGGTLVLMDEYVLSARIDLPAHTGKIKWTSVYSVTDYRKAGAAIKFSKSVRIGFGGPTEIDRFVFTDAAGGVLAANFHDLTVGADVATLNASGAVEGKILITGGANNNASVGVLGAGKSSTLTVKGGAYSAIVAFSRSVPNLSHLGTVTVNLSGNTTVGECVLGASATGAKGGTTVLNMADNATISKLFLANSDATAVTNGDVTLNVYDNASVKAIDRSDTALIAGTSTVHVYSENASLPANPDSYFDVTNIHVKTYMLTLSEITDAASITSVIADGKATNASITDTENGVCISYVKSEASTSLTVTVRDSGYTVYNYAVTEADGEAVAVLADTENYVGDVIYIGAFDGNGLTPETPVSSIAKAYAFLIGNGGTFVVCDEVTMGTAIVAPEHTGSLTVTSVYGGVDYREIGAKLVYPTSTGWHIGGETIFENLTLDIDTTAVISGAFHPLTFDEGIEVINDYVDADGNGLFLIGGHNNSTNALAEYPDDTSVTVRSGHIRCIIGFSRYCGARVHTGTAHINVEGDAYVRYIFGGATQGSATAKDTIITVADRAIVENIYTGGSIQNNLTTGKVIIDVTGLSGGDIYEFDTVSISTSDGKVELHYDPRTVADGITTMAGLARFKVLSLCDLAGAHTYGEAYANPFGGGLTAHTCAICSYTKLVEEAPAKVTDGVVFVADGGFGDGLSPFHPVGNLEDAFTALGDEGGTVVLIGETTLPINMTWKISASHASFQEPMHTGKVLVTSVYDGADYREKGAKLIFDGNMHYRLSGPTTFDGIVVDTVGNPATNLIAARYNPLVFGEDCKMLKTVRDNYQLWVVGGYQYFRYTDFIGVKIDDPYLEMVTPARPIAWDSVPADLTQFSYVAGSGKTHTPSLQKDAAAAFEAMFKDMKAEGLYLPYCGWNFRSAHTQYGIFSDQLGDRRVKGQDFATAYHGVEVSCSIPGSSEHQLGFAFDINDERLEELYPGNAHGHYDKTPEWQWIIDNGHKYGIIHRFTKAKTAVTGFVYEAWHFRYVGVEHATAIAETDYCLEEYVAETMGMFAKDSSVTVLSGDFYQVMGGSRGCDYLTFTGTNRVTVGEGATVVNLVDVDEEVITEGFGEPTCIGDTNGDAVVSLTDVLRVLKACTDGTVALDKANADMNKDAVIDIRDALLILKACLNG